MLGVFFIAVALPNLVPAHWNSADPKSLDLLKDSPVNCLLVEQPAWSRAFVEPAHQHSIEIFGVVRPGDDPVAETRRAMEAHLDGVALEGSFQPAVLERARTLLEGSKMAVVELGLRSQMRLQGPDPIVGTFQGVWPGIQPQQEVKAGPTASAWIDTNTGFLRFARAATSAAVWIANTPPPHQAFPLQRYLQAIGDAGMTGARWVVTLDDDFLKRLLAGEDRARADWHTINDALRYYERHNDWRSAQPFGNLALVEDTNSGALLSGGVLDMIAVKHTPVRPIPASRLSESAIAPSQLAVNVDPQSLDDHQKDVLRAYTRAGGTLLTGPPGWRFPQPRKDQITLEKADLEKLDEIWKEVNSFTGRHNLGARLFNVSSMLSNLLELPDHSQVILHLVNYSDYPVDNVTVQLLGNYKSATLYRPEGPPIKLKGYDGEDGTAFDIDRVDYLATVVLTR